MKVLSMRAIAALPLHILYMDYMCNVHGHRHVVWLVTVTSDSRVLSCGTICDTLFIGFPFWKCRHGCTPCL
jgi:hypothetical protein